MSSSLGLNTYVQGATTVSDCGMEGLAHLSLDGSKKPMER